jgi:methylmalonyl-CoA/ethylmalonyl-CoA epimerase
MITPETTLRAVGQVLVPISDIDRACDFYGRVLGLPEWGRFGQIAFYEVAGVRIYLAPVPQADFQGRATVYFWVDDVHATIDRLTAAGAELRTKPHVTFGTDAYDLWMAFVTDPDGNHVGLMREAPKGTERG